LFKRLPYAKCFTIDIDVWGNLRVFHDNPDLSIETSTIDENELWQGRGMADQLEALKRKEKFVYTLTLLM